MPARSLCFKFFRDALSSLHLYRRNALLDATSAVIHGASLTLTSIGRHLCGHAHVKHKIKRIDRLLGNSRLHQDAPVVFERIAQRLLCNMSRVFILIDWSSYHNEAFQLLRASLACDGRSLPLISKVVPKRLQGNPQIHQHFLASLARAIPAGTEVVVITDAGFHGCWFQQISDRGWTYLCRVQGNHYYCIEDKAWIKVSEAGDIANSTPQSLGKGLLGRNKNARHCGYFYLFKQKDKGRKNHRSKEKKARSSMENNGRAGARRPWLIFTNTTRFTARQVMKIYSRRMQIEQNFRDEKNTRYGFGLRESHSGQEGRLEVLSLIASLASILMWLCGYHFENSGLHMRYQANTMKARRVLSLLKLAENVLRHSPQVFRQASPEKSLQTLHKSYTAMILVY